MKEPKVLSKIGYFHPVQKALHKSMYWLVTRHLLKTKITPNMITISWILIQIVGAVVMVFGTYGFNVLGVILYNGAALLDYVDGQMARIRKTSSYKGAFLEDLGIYFGSPLFFIGFSIGTALTFREPLYIVLGIVAAISVLYSKLAVVNPYSYSPRMRKEVLKIKSHLEKTGQAFCFTEWGLIDREFCERFITNS